MSYRIVFQKDARQELQEAENTYGAGFTEEVFDWLSSLASEAQRRDYSFSIDILELVEAAEASKPKNWKRSWRRWVSQPLLEKLRTLYVVAKKRCPPWELRSAVKRFTVVDAFACELLVAFEVDHPLGRIIIRQFDGLPGGE